MYPGAEQGHFFQTAAPHCGHSRSSWGTSQPGSFPPPSPEERSGARKMDGGPGEEILRRAQNGGPGPLHPCPPGLGPRAGPCTSRTAGGRKPKESQSCTTVFVLSPVLLFWGSGSGSSKGEKRDRLAWEQPDSTWFSEGGFGVTLLLQFPTHHLLATGATHFPGLPRCLPSRMEMVTPPSQLLEG